MAQHNPGHGVLPEPDLWRLAHLELELIVEVDRFQQSEPESVGGLHLEFTAAGLEQSVQQLREINERLEKRRHYQDMAA